MSSSQKKAKELRAYVKEAINSKHNKPATKIYKKIIDSMNSDKTLIPPFIEVLKAQLSNFKDSQSLYLLFDLIEYSTCRCGEELHLEYNSKSFLKEINSAFGNPGLTNEVKEKALYLVQFWKRFFKEDTVKFKNFPWYYTNIKSKGIPFPADTESPYEHLKVLDVSEAVNLKESQMDVSDLNKKQLKLFNDLNIVVDNIKVANTMIDEKENAGLQDVIMHLNGMEKKMKGLPKKLQKSNEEFLYKYLMAILDDISATKLRYKRFKDNKPVPKFTTFTKSVIKEYKQSISNVGSNLSSEESDEDDFVIQKESMKQESDNNLYGKPSNNKKKSGFDNIGNEFYINEVNPQYESNTRKEEDDFLGYDMSMNQTSNIKPKTQTNFKKEQPLGNDLDLLDLATITEDKAKEVQNMIKFGVQNDQNHMDMDFTAPKKTSQPADIINVKEQKPYVPQDVLKFEKVENQVHKDKPEYDPFGDINDFDLLGEQNKPAQNNNNNNSNNNKPQDDFDLF